MTTVSLRGVLRDGIGGIVGDVEVTSKGSGLYVGRIELAGASPEAVALFEQYEAIVDDQLLALVDDLDRRIADMDVALVSPGLEPQPVRDLQVYPRARSVSFRIIVADASSPRP